MAGVLIRRGEDTQRVTGKKEGHVMTGAEIGAMKLQAKGHQRHQSLQPLGRGKAGCSPTGFRGNMALPTLRSDLLASRCKN